MEKPEVITARFARVAGTLDERGRRAVAAAEALALGWGGISAVARATGLSRDAIRTGIKELRGPVPGAAPGRVRRPGGGRKQTVDATRRVARTWSGWSSRPRAGTRSRRCAGPARACASWRRRWASWGTASATSGSPRRCATWATACKATARRARAATTPTATPSSPTSTPRPQAFLAAGDPAIAVDTKKKELVGDFKNGGREWRPKGEPEEVRVHDFVDPRTGAGEPLRRVRPGRERGLGQRRASTTTPPPSRWRRSAAGGEGAGGRATPGAQRLLITADGGGSNGSRVRLWKWELQRLADETGLTISVCHFPPGTSKWNKIEHRLFSFITQNWRGKPLVSYAVILSLIAATTTATGLTVESSLDTRPTPPGSKSPTRRWPRSTSSATPSTANGTTPSLPMLAKSTWLFIDGP